MTAIAASAVAMCKTLGSIICSGPTNVSVDNLASRIDQVTSRVVERYNSAKQPDDPTRARFHLVLRGFKLKDEAEAFQSLLRDPHNLENAVSRRGWKPASRWQLDLSCTFWLLAAFRAKVKDVRDLRPDDSPALLALQQEIDGREDLARLRDLATGNCTWQEYADGKTVKEEDIIALLKAIVSAAEMLCTTPALTESKDYRIWKISRARGVVVDEAACIHRADLYCVWGNTLLPCMLGGDPKQLKPVVMSSEEKDELGNLYHRLVDDGKLSPLEFLQASGIPVYRLRTELRMADGMYDWVSEVIYRHVPFEYATSCRIDQPQFDIGRALEDHIQQRYPDVSPPPAGKLWPVFIHCEDSRVFVDELTKSKRSPDQVKISLDFVLDFVKAKRVEPSRLILLAPYAANVSLINRQLKKPEYSPLAGMQPASTIDSFHGKEGDIAVVVMGTAYPRPGPGFTSDENRLTVCMSRQKCGLVVVGDINVTGPFSDDEDEDDNGKRKGKGNGKGKGKGPTKAKGKAQERFIIEGANGEIYWTKATVMRNLYTKWHDHGRVITIPAAPRLEDTPSAEASKA